MRNRFKTKLLALTRDQVMDAAGRYFDETNKRQAVGVISGEERLKAANDKLADNRLKLIRI